MAAYSAMEAWTTHYDATTLIPPHFQIQLHLAAETYPTEEGASI